MASSHSSLMTNGISTCFKENMKGVTPILSAIAPAETMKRKDGAHSGNPTVRKAVAAGKPQHVQPGLSARQGLQKNGRGFGFTGLHYHHNWKDDNFRKCVLNGIAWTAQLEIPKTALKSTAPRKNSLMPMPSSTVELKVVSLPQKISFWLVSFPKAYLMLSIAFTMRCAPILNSASN